MELCIFVFSWRLLINEHLVAGNAEKVYKLFVYTYYWYCNNRNLVKNGQNYPLKFCSMGIIISTKWNRFNSTALTLQYSYKHCVIKLHWESMKRFRVNFKGLCAHMWMFFSPCSLKAVFFPMCLHYLWVSSGQNYSGFGWLECADHSLEITNFVFPHQAH